MSTINWRALETAARKAARLAYCPYSKFHVGAAFLMADGSIVSGCNVENAAYGSTICAERVALAKAVSENMKKFAALVVAAGETEPATPCGSCLQVLTEFCSPEMPIRCVTLKSDASRTRNFTLRELLPHTFALRQ